MIAPRGRKQEPSSRTMSLVAGLVERSASPDIPTARAALDHGNGTSISSDSNATGKDRLRLSGRDAFVYRLTYPLSQAIS